MSCVVCRVQVDARLIFDKLLSNFSFKSGLLSSGMSTTERNGGDKKTNKMTKSINEDDDKGGKLLTTSAGVVAQSKRYHWASE